MKNAHPTKKGPGRRAVTKADIGNYVPVGGNMLFIQRKLAGRWLPGAKLRKRQGK